MSRISRQIVIGALTLIFLGSGCGVINRPEPTPVWTVPPGTPLGLLTVTSASSATTMMTATPANVTLTPVIPITGENDVSIQCQFCVADEAHAMLVFPDSASFDVSSSTPVTCLTADVVNGQRIVICRGPQAATFNLNICSDPSNCLEFLVELESCPLLQAGATPLSTGTPNTPIILTPINTPKESDPEPTQPANTAVPSPTSTPAGVPVPPTQPVDIPSPSPTIPVPTSTTEPPTPEPTSGTTEIPASPPATEGTGG